MKIIDLTHTITNEMPVYPGEPGVTLNRSAAIGSKGYSNHVLHINMHTGTHIDTPGHAIQNGKKITDYSVGRFVAPGILIDVRGQTSINDLGKCDIPLKDKIVLFYTGCGKLFGKREYYNRYPTITDELAQKLVNSGVSMIGLDSPSPDYSPFNVHKYLFENDILIIENLTNLDLLVGVKEFDIFALPIKIKTDGALARVIAVVKL